MKNAYRYVITGLLCLLSALTCVAALRIPVTETAAIPAATTRTGYAEYYLKDRDGLVAVYRGGSEQPMEITDIETATLNDNDIQMLKDGIPAQNRTELLMLIEDLGS